jgi:serine phosphatase RsbU (regulator of sigma subunit)/CHASE3 domain sensor protein
VKSGRTSPFFIVAVALFIVIALFAVAGAYVRTTVLSAWVNDERTRTARGAALDVLSIQVDEETGIRGFAATRENLYLQPYYAGTKRFDSAAATLRRTLNVIDWPDRIAIVNSIAATNSEWQNTIARPIIAAKPANLERLSQRGKTLVDQFRKIIGDLDDNLAERRKLADDEIGNSINRVTAFVISTVIVMVLLVFGYALQQRTLQRRLEDERRAAAEAQAAYRTEKRISDTLQEAFMLKPMPNVPRVRLSGIYVPATEDTRVGGDWYDAVEVDDSRVMFAVGDVAGHGLAAAVAMNQTRQSLLAAALGTRNPAVLLARVNAELIRSQGRMVTAVCGYADSTAYTFTYATAGHPPPILFEPGRGARLLDFGGVPLGVIADASYREHTVQTVPGAMLVLYTDGAIEHSRDVFEGERALIEAVNNSLGTREDPSAFIRDAIFDTREANDDVAIVTITFAEGGERTGRLPAIDDVKLSAAGPTAGPGAVTSIAPRALLKLLQLPDRLAS